MTGPEPERREGERERRGLRPGAAVSAGGLETMRYCAPQAPQRKRRRFENRPGPNGALSPDRGRGASPGGIGGPARRTKASRSRHVAAAREERDGRGAPAANRLHASSRTTWVPASCLVLCGCL